MLVLPGGSPLVSWYVLKKALKRVAYVSKPIEILPTADVAPRIHVYSGPSAPACCSGQAKNDTSLRPFT